MSELKTKENNRKGDGNMELEIFKNAEFGEIRTIIGEDGEPWFVGKDVATALGYKNTRDALYKHVDAEDKKDAPIQDSIGRKQKTPIINESGLYSLVASSKTATKEFKARFLNALQEGGFISGDTTFVSSRKEIEFISDLETALSEINITGTSQYNVDNYRIDFYIPSKNIAVEYDEQQHFTPKNQKEDKERQNHIEKKLGCTFVRCNYKDNNIVNIMKVLKVLGTF